MLNLHVPIYLVYPPFHRRKRRESVKTKETIVTAWLRSVAERWEHQPDSDDIHMAFPSKTVRFVATSRP